MRRKSCTDDRYLQCLFCKLFNRDRYGNACRIIRRFTDLLQLYGPCNRFRPFLYFGEDGFCLVQRIQYNVAGIYTDCRWRDQDVTRHMEAGNTTGISFFIRLLYAASIDWGSKPTSEVVASNCFCMSLWIVFLVIDNDPLFSA